MRTHWRSSLLAAVATVTLLGACSGGSSDKVAATAKSTTTTAEADPTTTTAEETSTTVASSESTTSVVTTAPANGVAAARTSTTRAAATVASPVPTTTAPPKIEGTITVYAAQSLSNAFTDIGKAFEAEHPGVSVAFNFAGSATLVTQIFQGAPADVFASADQPNMDRLASSGLIEGKSRIFTKNLLHIVVAKGNPKGVATLADLARTNVATVLCAANVPCGNYARQALEKAGVQVTPKSNESSVAGVMGRVQSGEADAGIVYVTDVLANNKVSGVDIPPEHNVVAEYPHAAIKNAPNPAGAQAFMASVESSSGQGLLAKYGFLHL